MLIRCSGAMWDGMHRLGPRAGLVDLVDKNFLSSTPHDDQEIFWILLYCDKGIAQPTLFERNNSRVNRIQAKRESRIKCNFRPTREESWFCYGFSNARIRQEGGKHRGTHYFTVICWLLVSSESNKRFKLLEWGSGILQISTSTSLTTCWSANSPSTKLMHIYDPTRAH